MKIFSKLWFWFVALMLFLTLVMHDFEWDKEIQSQYIKHKMFMLNVNFSEIDKGFEHLRVYADKVDMDDMQSNMVASNVRAIFFKRENQNNPQATDSTIISTYSGELLASSAIKTPQEIKFWGDVRIVTSENERLRADEVRYYSSYKDIYSPATVTLWKDDMVITGQELRMNTQTKEGSLARDVLIRIWKAPTNIKSNPNVAYSTFPSESDINIASLPYIPQTSTTTNEIGLATYSKIRY